MVDNIRPLQKKMEDAVRHLLASGAESIKEQITPTLSAVLPAAMAPEASEASKLEAAQVLPVLRSICLDVAAEAARAQQPPMQYTLRGAAAPAIPRLMQIAIVCQEHRLMDQSHVLQVLEELQDVMEVEHCLDIITWLEEQRALLASPAYKSGQQQLIRLCNAIHKRLGKHDVIPRARLLMLIAICTPLFDRSGLNVTGGFAPADPPQEEEVPPDAVDSAGLPVDITLYKKFWSLQPMMQGDLSKIFKSDGWDNLHSTLQAVLGALDKSPATVAALHTVANEAGPAAGTPDAAAAAGGSNASSDCYLSSYKLFRLQLADSAFRRGFLVQVLVLLRTLLLPGKQPLDTLKDKARMQAVELEKSVYKLLAATPRDGDVFAKAVQDVLQRETTWVEWKKGKTLGPARTTPAPSAAAGSKAQPTQGCIQWNLPPLESLSAAVEARKAAAAQQAQRQAAQVQEGLQLKRQVDTLGQVYDWGGGIFEEPQPKRRAYLRALGDTSSSLTYWCQEHVQQELQGPPPPLISGLKVSEQNAYPVPERVCEQMLREMAPSAGIEAEYKRVVFDDVYRWRMARAVAQEAPQYDGSLITADGLEPAMLHELMPQSLRSLVPQDYVELHKKKEEEEAAKKGGDKAAQATGKKPAKAGGAAAGSKAQNGSGGGGSTPAAAAAAVTPAPSAGTVTEGMADGEDGEVDTAAGAAADADADADAAAVKDAGVHIKQEEAAEVHIQEEAAEDHIQEEAAGVDIQEEAAEVDIKQEEAAADEVGDEGAATAAAAAEVVEEEQEEGEEPPDADAAEATAADYGGDGVPQAAGGAMDVDEAPQ